MLNRRITRAAITSPPSPHTSGTATRAAGTSRSRAGTSRAAARPNRRDSSFCHPRHLAPAVGARIPLRLLSSRRLVVGVALFPQPRVVLEGGVRAGEFLAERRAVLGRQFEDARI